MRAKEFIPESLAGGGTSQNISAPKQNPKRKNTMQELNSPLGGNKPNMPVIATANELKRRKS